jgi:hypothetical protein
VFSASIVTRLSTPVCSAFGGVLSCSFVFFLIRVGVCLYMFLPAICSPVGLAVSESFFVCVSFSLCLHTHRTLLTPPRPRLPQPTQLTPLSTLCLTYAHNHTPPNAHTQHTPPNAHMRTLNRSTCFPLSRRVWSPRIGVGCPLYFAIW